MSPKASTLSYNERLDFTIETAHDLIKESGDEYAIKEIAGIVVDAFAETLNSRMEMPQRINKAVDEAKRQFENSGIQYKSHQRHCGENMGRNVLSLAWNVANGNKQYRRALSELRLTMHPRPWGRMIR